MKPFSFLVVLSSILLMISCNQDKKTSSPETKDNKDSTQVVPTESKNENIDDRSESLAKMAPLSADEMKELLPMELMGAQRNNEDVNSAIGTNIATAEYRINDSTTLELAVIDCAGPAGAGVYGSQYVSMLNLSEEDDKEYTRTIDFNGEKAFENCSKTNVQCNLTWFSGRFLVSLSGNLPASKLKEIAAALKF